MTEYFSSFTTKEVTDATTDLFIEVANFDPIPVLGPREPSLPRCERARGPKDGAQDLRPGIAPSTILRTQHSYCAGSASARPRLLAPEVPKDERLARARTLLQIPR